MILPKKQLSLNESFWGFGAFLLEHIAASLSVEELWEYYKNSYESKKYSTRFSFDQFIMTLDFLFIIGAIKMSEEGVLSYENSQSKS